ncbi:putative toxin-antitoxin system antitoxin component (TIGR02293 family) [Pseudomonas sp. WPR_5_2]|nr:putative toxin-antitoxin system antitoxin component (TIGR02293 family) [Pseudomonas sp. WPR_5_2]
MGCGINPFHTLSDGGSTMIAGAMHKDAYRDYRVRLELLLHIPANASEQEIHELIEAGFLTDSVMALCDIGVIGPSERNQIIPLRTLKARLATHQRLTLHESDRMFRFAHIIAMAVTLFGSNEKAKRWLSKPKDRFSGKPPFAMLSTFLGTRLVEEMLIQTVEGIAF